MTTTSAVEQKGLAGVYARLKAGKAHGWGVFHMGSWPMMIGGMMMIISAFLPWVYVTLTQEIIGEAFVLRGTDGPGVMTLAVGCLSFAGAFIPWRRLAIAHAAVPGLLVAGICLLQAWNLLAGNMNTQWGSFLPGMGLVLAAGGAVVLTKASWTMYKRWPVT
ncbi:hypothetical protein [Nesterenkonia muleiensis]|uniref:hypothetical protein n=1 Tax=Nesterenkonia muleiensis TaxID=2282648 RepID=UPI000E7305FB|nr:hypothetical protein [Nesterenkonia muleiensis]